ncbi:MAG: hypothetical protein ACM3S0_04380 [Acidobacteriota bacterium]
MLEKRTAFFSLVNLTRYQGQLQGHYESFYQRANHPTRPLAFWIRYTLFSPKAHPERALGELWAVFFNGETNQHLAVKQEFPLSRCIFSTCEFHVEIGNARLNSRELYGAIQAQDRTISWELSFSGDSDPLLLQQFESYGRRFPPAKSLVSLPLARYKGKLSVNGETIDVADWIGSQNHNWGTRHTDHYAYGQVAGFDTHPDSFLEVVTARMRIGPFWTPPLTLIVLRHKGEEHASNGLLESIRAHGSFDYFTWQFKSRSSQDEFEGTISAPRNAFVGFNYYNPPGGTHHCLNTMIASCTVQLKNKARGTAETLQTQSRACFEILTDDRNHAIPISA